MRLQGLLVVATALCAALFTPLALAESIEEQLAGYLRSAEFTLAVENAAVDADRRRKTGCDRPKALRHAMRSVIKPPQFAGNAAVPSDGAWLEKIDIDRCGTTIAENILVVIDKGTRKFAPLLPGVTKAGPLLQRDAMQAAVAVAGLKNTEAEKNGARLCPRQEGFTVIDTRFLRERIPIVNDRSGKMTAGAWDETWTSAFCGRQIPVQMHFDGDGQGGTNYTARPSE